MKEKREAWNPSSEVTIRSSTTPVPQLQRRQDVTGEVSLVRDDAPLQPIPGMEVEGVLLVVIDNSRYQAKGYLIGTMITPVAMHGCFATTWLPILLATRKCCADSMRGILLLPRGVNRTKNRLSVEKPR